MAKGGIGRPGKDRLKRNWEEIESGNLSPATPRTSFAPRIPENYAEPIGLAGPMLGESTDFEAEEQYGVQTSEYGVYHVNMLTDVPRNYYKGPNNSTCVLAHKFIPMSRETDALGRMVVNTGTVYVRFGKKRSSRGSVDINRVYKYTNVPLAVYQNFRNNYSKGRFVHNVLNSYNPTKVTNDAEFNQYCYDM